MSKLSLNMSIISAVFESQNTANSNLLNLQKKNDPSFSHLDWSGAENWELLISEKFVSNDLRSICEVFCFEFLQTNKTLLALAAHGRNALISNLLEDELQVFRNASLLEKLPDEKAIMWWDKIKMLGRFNIDEQLLAQGRLGESWTIEEELKLLEGSGLKPEWPGLDGDHFGYDILSYRYHSGKYFQIQIEVKTFNNEDYPHFYLTSNEWSKAEKANENYIFYIWCISSKSYKIFTVNDIISHIPKNNNKGSWESVLITNLW